MSTATDRKDIRSVFQGDHNAWRRLVERYQPIVYAVALAQTGNVIVADAVTAKTFQEAYERLASLTDPRKLGHWLCAHAHREAEALNPARRGAAFRPRARDMSAVQVDLKWLQSDLVDPLMEELSPFRLEERKGLLLNVLCGSSARTIANLLKIEPKDAAEQLARTRENVDKQLLKELAAAVQPEMYCKERMIHIIRTTMGEDAAIDAARRTRLGRPRRSRLPLLVGLGIIVVLGVGGYFGYRAFMAPAPSSTSPENAKQQAAAAPASSDDAPAAAPEPGQPAPAPDQPVLLQTLKGRVIDDRFADGVPGLLIEAAGKTAETDPYGVFEIRDVPKGRHNVTVRCADQVLVENYPLETGKNVLLNITDPTLNVKSAESNPCIVVRITDAIPTPFRFCGRVVDAQTQLAIPKFQIAAYKGAPICIPPFIYDEFRDWDTADGQFCEHVVAIATYTFYIRARGYSPTPVTISINENWDNDSITTVNLHRAASIQGKLIAPNGMTIGNATVHPRYGVPESVIKGGKLWYTRTDSRGEFTLFDVPVGPAWLLFDHRDYGIARAIVDVQPGQISTIKVQVPSKGALTGDITVNGRPARFEELRISSAYAGSRVVSPEYPSPGQYEVTKLPPGEVTVIGRVIPGAEDRWIGRVYDQPVKVSINEPNWVDFNFITGTLNLNVQFSAEGKASVFLEVAIARDDAGRSTERVFYEVTGQNGFTVTGLPECRGEVVLYTSTTPVAKEKFLVDRKSLNKTTKPFEIIEGLENVVAF